MSINHLILAFFLKVGTEFLNILKGMLSLFLHLSSLHLLHFRKVYILLKLHVLEGVDSFRK